MVAVTYGVARVSAEPAAKAGRAKTAAPAQELVRALHGCADRGAHGAGAARNRDAYRVCCRTRSDERGNRLVKTGSGDMPFGGWPR